MSRKRAASPSHIDDFDDEFCENNCSSGKYYYDYFFVKIIKKKIYKQKIRSNKRNPQNLELGSPFFYTL